MKDKLVNFKDTIKAQENYRAITALLNTTYWESLIDSSNNGEIGSVAEYAILFALRAKERLGATEIKKCPRLHTNTDINKSNKHISFFLSTARHTPIKASDMTQRIP